MQSVFRLTEECYVNCEGLCCRPLISLVEDMERTGRMIKKLALTVIAGIGILAFVMTYVTPWPSVLIIRAIFDAGAEKAATALAPKVPQDVVFETGFSYDQADPDAKFDIYRGATARSDGPTVVWFHGGGFVSGRREDIANYLKILAGRGLTVVNVDYTIAPEAHYPTPIRQAHKALAYLSANAAKHRLNASKFVLAGDSAGAQIAAQTAAISANPAYAKAVGIAPGASIEQLAGTLLHCGVYDVRNLGKGGGVIGWFVRSTVWAYSGERNPAADGPFATMSVITNLNAAFPPTFISAGNADPLGPQSVALAAALREQNSKLTELFFPPTYQPPLAHEYQFDLDTEAGKLALDKSVSWLNSL
jgi:acetyl esterase